MTRAEITEAMARVRALLRCYECMDDGQDTDVGRPMLDQLTAVGWLEKRGRANWGISPAGQAVIDIFAAIPGGEAALIALLSGEAVVVPKVTLASVQSTQAMRARARELATGGDDFDRAVLIVLDDLERFVPDKYPPDVTEADHIAHDMRQGRFPRRSDIADFLVERAAATPYAAKEGRDG